jgi:hypothetical protein
MDGGMKSMIADEIDRDLTLAVLRHRLHRIDMALITRGQYGVKKVGMSCTTKPQVA